MSDERRLPKVVVWARDVDGLPAMDDLACRQLVVGDRDTIALEVHDAEVIVVADFHAQEAEALWQDARAMQWVHAMSAGVDHVLTPTLQRSDAILTNGQGCFERPIAEFVLLQILSLVKDARAMLQAQRAARWQWRTTGQLAGREVLVVGPGAIGRQIAELLGAVGCRVDGAGRTARVGQGAFLRIRAVAELADYVGEYDAVVIAAPLTDDTRGLIDARVLTAMRPTAFLINIARGAIVDEPALIDALELKTIAGAALDVFAVEPLPADSPLWRLPHVLISAHMSGDFDGWRAAQWHIFTQHYARYLAGQTLTPQIDKSRGFAVTERDSHDA